MKKYLYILALGLSVSTFHAQDATDALRFSLPDLNGTARFRAMSGAFGALGGDLSSLNVNPAGSAVYNHNEIGFTLSNQNTKTSSNYFGTTTNTTNNSFDFGQIGVIWIFKNYDTQSDWKKISFGVNYENINNFDNNTFSSGTNPSHSIADYFLSYANGVPLNVITGNNFTDLFYKEQQAYLGYYGYVINPVTNSGGNSMYVTNLNGTNNFYQQNSTYSYGYNGKLIFNMATAYKDKIYFGLNLNSHFTDYRKNSSFYESYSGSLGQNPNSGVQSVRFDNYLHTYGSGFSFQIGAIAKITNQIRTGFTYESPTWYHLTDDLLQNLTVNCPDCSQNGNPIYADPNITMIYPTYTVHTPSKYTGSFAYIFNKSGLISVDYIMKDYGNINLQPDYLNSDLNRAIPQIFSFTNEVRLGGEYRIQQLSLRGGYRFEESPYRNKQTLGDLNSYSAGFGYNFGPAKFDFSYSFIKRNSQQSFFTQGLTDPANVKTKYNNIAFTLLFPF